MEGLYRVSYSTPDGAHGWLSVEATSEYDAREYAEHVLARWDGGWKVTTIRWMREPILSRAV